MDQKLDYYDLLSAFVPGVLLLWWSLVCFPAISAANPKVSDAVGAIVFVVVALFFGQLIQALASVSEPLLQRSWGGKLSTRSLSHPATSTRILDTSFANRIRDRLRVAAGTNSAPPDVLFQYALHLAYADPHGRARLFNQLYAYHRSLLTAVALAIIVFGLSLQHGAVSAWSESVRLICGMMLLAMVILLWHRTRQRDEYFVREVLLLADRSLTQSAELKSSANQKETPHA